MGSSEMTPEEFMYLVDNKDVGCRYKSASDETWVIVIKHYPEYRKNVAMNVTISEKIKKMLSLYNVETPESDNLSSSSDDVDIYYGINMQNWNMPFYKQNINLKKKRQDSLDSDAGVIYLRNIVGIKK